MGYVVPALCAAAGCHPPQSTCAVRDEGLQVLPSSLPPRTGRALAAFTFWALDTGGADVEVSQRCLAWAVHTLARQSEGPQPAMVPTSMEIKLIYCLLFFFHGLCSNSCERPPRTPLLSALLGDRQPVPSSRDVITECYFVRNTRCL